MKQHQKSIGINDEWLTTPGYIEKLGPFDLDPCDAIGSPFKTAKHTYTISDNGLYLNWFGRVWLNPPFNRNERHKWMKVMSEHNNGIMLIPAACETYAFKKYVWGKCSGLLFLDHRPHFHYITGVKAKANSGCTICLVAYGEDNLRSLIDSGLGVVVVTL